MGVELAEPTRRRGGREARRAMRSAPLDPEARPVGPGMEGGRFGVLSQDQVARVHGAALDVLETIGLGNAIPSCIEVTTAAGAFVNAAGRLCFPRELVEDTIAGAARNITLHGRDPRHDMQPGGKRVYFGTAGAAVHTVDPMTREYRESALLDLYQAARVVEALDNVHFFQRTLTARDMPGGRALDLNTAYACVAGTSKHVGTSFVSPESVQRVLDMLHVIAGGEAAWRARPFVSQSNCFVVPPLKFAEDACRCLEVAVRGSMPVLLLSAGQAGATAPAALAGTVVQATAEVLAGLCYVNAIRRGAPAIFGTWPFVSDLRTGAMSGGSGEQSLLSAACAQMAHFYDLPGGTASGMTDAKLPDAQAGYEKGLAHALVGHAGANLIYEAAGMHASLLGFCLESLVIDNDLIGAVQRTMKGIAFSDEALSVDVMRAVSIDGPNHYLGSDQTLNLMQTEYLYPEIADRTSPKQWTELGSKTIVELARDRVAEILEGPARASLPPAIDAQIRADFDILLPRDAMGTRGQA